MTSIVTLSLPFFSAFFPLLVTFFPVLFPLFVYIFLVFFIFLLFSFPGFVFPIVGLGDSYGTTSNGDAEEVY
ncbi:MAG: hypothetical protein A2X81_02135 [Desulfobacterales bacterium GWB2_56_26]|nr:MAG: hypothetical protein A2X81_02135 [Desulfobacterales bacterium GWB2_56_26]